MITRDKTLVTVCKISFPWLQTWLIIKKLKLKYYFE